MDDRVSAVIVFIVMIGILGLAGIISDCEKTSKKQEMECVLKATDTEKLRYCDGYAG